MGLLVLLALPAGELLAVIRAQAALIRALRSVRRLPVGEPVHVARTKGRSKGVDAGPVARLEQAVARAARHGLFRPSCLVRSVALADLLQRNGLADGRLRVGVRWADGEFRAHAWPSGAPRDGSPTSAVDGGSPASL